jgi:hypothetical protein
MASRAQTVPAPLRNRAPSVAARAGRAPRDRVTRAQHRAGRKLIAEMLVHNEMPPREVIEAIKRSWKV